MGKENRKKLTASGFFTGKAIGGGQEMFLNASVVRGMGINATSKIAVKLKVWP